MKILIIMIAVALSGCTPNIIDDWDRGFVVRESSGESSAWYMQLFTGKTSADACGVATTESPIEGRLLVRYTGTNCAVTYEK